MDAPLRADLNEFLFATIARDAGGMPITMISAMARTGVDPWDEAARLAGLSLESAAQSVVALLATVPNGPSSDEEAATTAVRLVALLNRSPKPKTDSPEATPAKVAVESKRVNPAVYYLAGLIFMIFAQWAMTSPHEQTPMDTSIIQDARR